MSLSLSCFLGETAGGPNTVSFAAPVGTQALLPEYAVLEGRMEEGPRKHPWEGEAG